MQKLNEPREKIQVSLDPKLVYDLKVQAIKSNLNIREAIQEAIKLWIHQKVSF